MDTDFEGIPASFLSLVAAFTRTVEDLRAELRDLATRIPATSETEVDDARAPATESLPAKTNKGEDAETHPEERPRAPKKKRVVTLRMVEEDVATPTAMETEAVSSVRAEVTAASLHTTLEVARLDEPSRATSIELEPQPSTSAATLYPADETGDSPTDLQPLEPATEPGSDEDEFVLVQGKRKRARTEAVEDKKGGGPGETAADHSAQCRSTEGAGPAGDHSPP